MLGNLLHCWSSSLQWFCAVRLLSTAAKSNTFVAQAEVISNRCAIYLLGPSKISVVLFLLHKQPCNRNRRTKTLRQNPKLSIEITGLRQNCTQDQKTHIKAQAWVRWSGGEGKGRCAESAGKWQQMQNTIGQTPVNLHQAEWQTEFFRGSAGSPSVDYGYGPKYCYQINLDT